MIQANIKSVATNEPTCSGNPVANPRAGGVACLFSMGVGGFYRNFARGLM